MKEETLFSIDCMMPVTVAIGAQKA